MGLLNFGKKQAQEKEPEGGMDFTYGVSDIFRLKDSDDVIVIGRLKGTIHVKDAIYISNPGDDNTSVTVSEILGLEKKAENGELVQPESATNERVSIVVKNGARIGLKPGSVIHSRYSTVADLHSAYINGIGDGYVAGKNAELSESDLNLMSITDLAETWRLLNFSMSKRDDVSQEEHNDVITKMGVMAKAMIQKMYALDHIYVAYNKKTNEPHLFSKTIRREQGYECTPPDIMVVTDAYEPVYSSSYEKSALELRKIENGEDKQGIRNFLGYCFFINGAQGVEFTCPEVAVAADYFMPKPDYSQMKEVDIPVTNPDIVRWNLMMGQIGKPNTEYEDLCFRLYYRFFGQALGNGRFLVPMSFPEGAPKPETNGNGTATFKEGTQLALAIQDGKDGRSAVRFYTDWKRFREEYDDSWNGLIETVDSMIEKYDIALNVTKFPAAGCYIAKDMYDDIKNMK